MPVFFAVDNTDFHNDSPDGKNEFRGIGQVINQTFQKTDDVDKFLAIKRSNASTTKCQQNPFPETSVCSLPTPLNESYPNFTGVISTEQLTLFNNLLIETGIYGNVTLNQILLGKHMKRGGEALTILYLALIKNLLSRCIF